MTQEQLELDESIPDHELKTLHQALISIDRIEEALAGGDYQRASDATDNLCARLTELMEESP